MFYYHFYTDVLSACWKLYRYIKERDYVYYITEGVDLPQHPGEHYHCPIGSVQQINTTNLRRRLWEADATIIFSTDSDAITPGQHGATQMSSATEAALEDIFHLEQTTRLTPADVREWLDSTDSTTKSVENAPGTSKSKPSKKKKNIYGIHIPTLKRRKTHISLPIARGSPSLSPIPTGETEDSQPLTSTPKATGPDIPIQAALPERPVYPPRMTIEERLRNYLLKYNITEALDFISDVRENVQEAKEIYLKLGHWQNFSKTLDNYVNFVRNQVKRPDFELRVQADFNSYVRNIHIRPWTCHQDKSPQSPLQHIYPTRHN